MKSTLLMILALFILMISAPYSSFGADKKKENPGKVMFLKYKCNSCHTVNSEKIGKDEKDKSEEDDEWEDEEEEELDPPDLSGAGIKRKAEWLHLYMRKKIANEEERKHKKRFKGTKDERKPLVDWLVTLKTPPPKKKSEAKKK